MYDGRSSTVLASFPADDQIGRCVDITTPSGTVLVLAVTADSAEVTGDGVTTNLNVPDGHSITRARCDQTQGTTVLVETEPNDDNGTHRNFAISIDLQGDLVEIPPNAARARNGMLQWTVQGELVAAEPPNFLPRSMRRRAGLALDP